MRCANDNRPPRRAAVRFRDTAIAVIVILLIAGATGSFNVQAAGTGPAHNSIQVPGA
jgi:hypothetical protein